jgi:hypothetical protein
MDIPAGWNWITRIAAVHYFYTRGTKKLVDLMRVYYKHVFMRLNLKINTLYFINILYFSKIYWNKSR